MQTVQVKRGRVLRAFYYKGEPTKVGSVVELPRPFALEMAAAQKLQLLDEPKAEAPAQVPAAAPKKGESNAR